MKFAAIIVAAGRGQRAGGGVPKQWRSLGHDPARPRTIDHTIAALRPHVARIVVVHHPDDAAHVASFDGTDDIITVAGGLTRSASVQAGLDALSRADSPDAITHVLIHDAARALTPSSVIEGVKAALHDTPGAAPALPVTDALWTGEAAQVTGTQERDGLYRAQTPQGFDFKMISAAYQAFEGAAADDVEVARASGLTVTITAGHEENFKITHPEDFARAEALIAARADTVNANTMNSKMVNANTNEAFMDIRLGNGYDVHRFGTGDHMWLCGVKIPHERSLQGHSDADVGMHALTDAIYGALAEGDIGRHFPPSDMQWKGAASDIFLRHAIELAREKGYELSNCDVTLVCEYPKVGPHAQQMQEVLAEIMSVDASKVSVKATTSERLGFTGRGEGIASLATAALIKM